jgi:pimeloyl-ACP methyl ester carboxylesterase
MQAPSADRLAVARIGTRHGAVIEMKSARVRSVELPNRVTLQYVERGRPGGLPLVLLHGITDSWRSFEPVLPHLPDSVHAFALTQRGHGEASCPTAGYRPADFASDVDLFMGALGLDAAVVVGHSMGSLVAQHFALVRPERVRGLALLGAFATLRHDAPMQALWRSTMSTLTDPIDPAFVLDFQRSTVAREIPPEFLDAVVAESLKVPARVWREAFGGLIADDVTPALHRIAVPTLILWGEADAMASASQQAQLARGIRGAELRVYAGCGHAPHWEEPRRVAADLAGFAAALRQPA